MLRVHAKPPAHIRHQLPAGKQETSATRWRAVKPHSDRCLYTQNKLVAVSHHIDLVGDKRLTIQVGAIRTAQVRQGEVHIAPFQPTMPPGNPQAIAVQVRQIEQVIAVDERGASQGHRMVERKPELGTRGQHLEQHPRSRGQLGGASARSGHSQRTNAQRAGRCFSGFDQSLVALRTNLVLRTTIPPATQTYDTCLAWRG